MGMRTAAGRDQRATPTRSYRSAVGLIRRLDALSGKLSCGLDAVGIAEQVMAEADSVVPTSSAGGVRALAPRRRSLPCASPPGTLPGAMAWAETLLREVLGVRQRWCSASSTSRSPWSPTTS